MLKQLIKKITPLFLLDFYYYSVAFFGALFFGFPSRRIFVLGVYCTEMSSSSASWRRDLCRPTSRQTQHRCKSLIARW